MKNYSWEILYMGFFLPGLFSLTFFIEGIYKIHKHENGVVTLILGTLFLIGLGIFYAVIMPK
ncbi:hypothetical protein A3G67_01700 [Candidatus Roizmanbacteria bacterium RIFCSPLOWO2_12_FULL_40_12]|uniref:Uncharacterized protein n=1 Tax=Candidatus Roizmanbacteria bacterium RIFCSPLOWO2_01_FULL_40_42 TaxID=1802066 RepID=A0A1F7J3X1_9BACT|nr:MAG: hypothetical protein A2779_04020 [Candidatus Roizmanbacteria bacterium RIFCSPHIGHO2_01_FULL_40_98]OGK28745.1 MAG: hypothetical protein A3C31_02300 [Candidatus Roizmanbacteria bacterium RIFCSPHIGHO2_02_FULL_40_53]OGK30200.1 MAG: hypothetical protein A2W49_01255 [Candidatus Roizmanbacteria bacterium RIFCSPHIGHO2_12_41_18]OGK36664.1 MAG: hypothetical protein A3E69_01770 [Candidatus Roizmanbacteria bacterium RIFCSPHIGHO2_12_FULL_40_130]OGK50305.1 MAG: hypothetical protein A3B50_02955 [Candi